MKKSLLLAAAGLILAGASAFAANVSLMINGENVFKTPTMITFDGDNAILHFADGTETHDMETVVMHFSSLSDVEDLTMLNFRGLVGDMLIVEGVADDTEITIYDVAGKQRARGVASRGRAEISVASLPAGVYMLRAGKDCVKFVKR